MMFAGRTSNNNATVDNTAFFARSCNMSCYANSGASCAATCSANNGIIIIEDAGIAVSSFVLYAFRLTNVVIIRIIGILEKLLNKEIIIQKQ